MPKNMTISVPDALHERLKTVKGDIQISRTCVLALTNAVDRVGSSALAAKVRFGCFSVEEAESLAFDAGMSWAAETAPLEHIVFIVFGGDPDELTRYAIINDGISTLLEKFGEDVQAGYGLLEYIRSEILEASPAVLPEHLVKRNYDDEHSEIVIAEAFLDGVRAIWPHIGPFIESELNAACDAHLAAIGGDGV